MKLRNLTTVILLMVFGLITTAQQMVPLPIDPKVKYGKLENGLTYYIRHNSFPKNRAEFYIAQNVGSILENDSQRGLAHFLEHMAFNGSKNFPGKSMLNYLEANGVKFGNRRQCLHRIRRNSVQHIKRTGKPRRHNRFMLAHFTRLV